jgi:hypothetical protein
MSGDIGRVILVKWMQGRKSGLKSADVEGL